MNKTILTPKKAKQIQNEIYRKMPAERKIKIAGQLFLLGQKLNTLKKQKIDEPRKTSLQNSKNFRKA